VWGLDRPGHDEASLLNLVHGDIVLSGKKKDTGNVLAGPAQSHESCKCFHTKNNKQRSGEKKVPQLALVDSLELPHPVVGQARRGQNGAGIAGSTRIMPSPLL